MQVGLLSLQVQGSDCAEFCDWFKPSVWHVFVVSLTFLPLPTNMEVDRRWLEDTDVLLSFICLDRAAGRQCVWVCHNWVVPCMVNFLLSLNYNRPAKGSLNNGWYVLGPRPCNKYKYVFHDFHLLKNICYFPLLGLNLITTGNMFIFF